MYDEISGTLVSGEDFRCSKAFSDELFRNFERTLIDEGHNFVRRSELLGTSDNNSIAKKYLSNTFLLNKEPILNLARELWDIKGVRVFCKSDVRQEFSSISRDFHPLCILSLYLHDMWKNGNIPACFIDKVVENLDYNGISSTGNPLYAENHLHLNGAYPCENSILDFIDGMTISDNENLPNIDGGMIALGGLKKLSCMLGDFSRFLFNNNIYGSAACACDTKKLHCYVMLGEVSNLFKIECSPKKHAKNKYCDIPFESSFES